MKDIRLIAFYLPQFHPIEENDAWWGKGFTEWTNVASAKPVYPEHYQPHVPADLGFYDLRLAEAREEQANLARNHGIEGFCYYYYYFNGKRLLNRPLDEVIASGKPDFPFCICWANENWTRKWDGRNSEILIEQFHSPEDDLEFIRQLIPALKDKRYIRVNNKLLLLVYRTELFPEPAKTSAAWRGFVRKELGEELYLCAINNFVKDIDPALIGFDGVVQFPLTFNPGCHIDKKVFASVNGTEYGEIKDNWFLNYPSAVNLLVHVTKPDYKFFRGVFPSWDNTPRRQQASSVFVNSSPEFYKLYLKTVIGLTRAEQMGDERLIFINAWNEWAEGAHLEPDKKYGLQFLEATRDALAEREDHMLLMEEITKKDAESRAVFESAGPLTERIDPEEKIRQNELKHQQQIALIEKKNLEALNGVINNYKRQLIEKQKTLERTLTDTDLLLQNSLQKEIAALKSSWTWRIGFFQTSTIRLLVNCLKNPYQFVVSKRYRWNNIYFYNTTPETPKPESGQKVEATTPPLGKPKECIFEIDPQKSTLVCVMDTFTKSCFAPEFNIISPSPDNWKKVLETQKLDAIFVESAWHGNDNTWESLTSSYSGPKKLEILQDLLSTGKKKGIPSIFWNKEDPVHFTRFIDTARLFDYVFTSDAEIIPKYQEQLGHKNIYALPFAAQHKIHNPIRNRPRNKNVSFAGSYYNFSFAERKLDMDLLLQPALAFGLDIFDRNYGATGINAEQFGFPAIYKQAVRGKLEYTDMLNAYKDYKVFLNVNSVKYSSTMFARRVFELLACGTPVISNYSKGIINLLGEDTVFISESEADTKSYLEQLLGDELFWWKKSLSGMRRVIEKHTYQDLTEEIFAKSGLSFMKPPEVSFLVIAVLASFEDAGYLSKIIQSQEYKPSGVLFIQGSGCEVSGKQKEELFTLFSGIGAELVAEMDEDLIRAALSGFENTHVAFFNPEHYYGQNYLRDYALAVRYSDARIMGKMESVGMDGAGKLVIPSLNADFRWVGSVPTGTLVLERELLRTVELRRLFNDKLFTRSTTDILSLDPFNFFLHGHEKFISNPGWVSENVGI